MEKENRWIDTAQKHTTVNHGTIPSSTAKTRPKLKCVVFYGTEHKLNGTHGVI